MLNQAGAVNNRHRVHGWHPILSAEGSQLRQNAEIDRLQLPRIADDRQLHDLIQVGELVHISTSATLQTSVGKEDRRYLRPWANVFLVDMGQAYYSAFGVPLIVTSAVRTVEQQHQLRRTNRNAAPETGERGSSHLAGTTFDLGKRRLTRKQHDWIEVYLKRYRDAGVIEAIEERGQSCFHVMVTDRYLSL